MPLTPEDVSNKRFTPVRLREGYDMGEVDQFLDEVEAELVRLTRENQDLRERLSTVQPGDGVAAVAPVTGPAQDTATPPLEPAEEAAEPPAEPPAAPPPPAAPSETIRVTTVAEASSAATRLLELATRNADELVAEARDEADRLVAEARAGSERLEAEALSRAKLLDAETDERRQQLFGDLERDRENLNAEVENLRSFEREYRSRLKSYFEQQLAALDGVGEAAAADDGPPPERLTSVLARDETTTDL